MTGIPRSFASDNCAGIHPVVLSAIAEANVGHAPSYGADPVTAEAIELFRHHFGEDAEVFFTFNGTGANVVGLQSLAPSLRGGHLCRERPHQRWTSAGHPSDSWAASSSPCPLRTGS